jgi:hypothetical protein
MTEKQLEERMEELYENLPELPETEYRLINKEMFVKGLQTFVKLGKFQILDEIRTDITNKVEQL